MQIRPLSSRQPLVVAHRGFHPSGGAFENSMPAFEAAIALGADRVESDIRRTKDGVFVLHHDPDVAGRPIAELSAAELPALPNGQPIPRLEQLLGLAAQTGARLCLELKETGYEQFVVDAVERALPLSQVELTSFNASSIKAIESWRPAAVTGLLAPRIWPWLRESAAWPWLARLADPLRLPIRHAAAAHADFISVDWRMVSNGLLDAAAGRGLGVDVWTVDDPARIGSLLRDARVRGVVTDIPDVALRLRDQLAVGRSQALVGAAAAQPLGLSAAAA